MATSARTVRRGLPRRPGGEPWPPAGAAPGGEPIDGGADASLPTPAAAASASPAPPPAVVDGLADAPAAGSTADPEAIPAASATTTPAASAPTIRRGLPRVAGGEPWPPAGAGRAPAPGAAAVPVAAASTAMADTPAVPPVGVAPAEAAVVGAQPEASGVAARRPEGTIAEASDRDGADGTALRRGLPRVAGGEPWPPAGFAPTPTRVPAPVVAPAADAATEPAAAVASVEADTTVAEAVVAPAASARPETTVVPEAPATTEAVAPEASAPRPRGRARRLALGAVAIVAIAALVVLVARWIVTSPGGQAFLAEYPGEVPLPDTAVPGFPDWVRWQHFFNVFLIVLIIRSGLQVRGERRPPASWTPKWSKTGRRISLTLWFHQSLDLLWVINGVVFVVLLFATGHWMRIVPTSWAVIPNALSAALQYASLDWPTEDGWVNYNSLQQLAYFTTVFVAAPLAIVTGVRMSGLWPARATRLSAAYPIGLARAVHFPVMLYFVAFIVVHVTLVLATGALRNLNHMYAGTDEENWVGFGLFVLSALVIAGGWVAARPLVIAPIAGVFGKVGR